MTHQSFDTRQAPPTEAGSQIAHLRHALAIAREVAGSARRADSGDGLDQAARISATYDRSSAVVRRRFDALAEETITWTGVAIEALLAVPADTPPRAAAAQLVRELETALAELARIVRV
jgi:hypothetical protein